MIKASRKMPSQSSLPSDCVWYLTILIYSVTWLMKTLAFMRNKHKYLRLWRVLVVALLLARRGFSPGTPVFSPKNQDLQIPIRSGTHGDVSRRSFKTKQLQNNKTTKQLLLSAKYNWVSKSQITMNNNDFYFSLRLGMVLAAVCQFYSQITKNSFHSSFKFRTLVT